MTTMTGECNHTFLSSEGSGAVADGCWYCGEKDGALEFSIEWDTPVHLCCVRKAVDLNPMDPEARIFAEELYL